MTAIAACSPSRATGRRPIRARASTGRTSSPPIVAAARELGLGSALIDGEVVALDREGRPSFQALQNALKEGGDAHLLRLRPARAGRRGSHRPRQPRAQGAPRGAAGRRAGADPLRRPYRRRGREAVRYAVQGGLRGRHLEARRRALSRPPQPELAQDQMHPPAGVRHRRLDAEREGPRLPLAAARPLRGRQAALCRQGRHRLRRRGIEELMAKLAPLERKDATVEAPRAAVRGAHWVEPKLVAEIAFTEFTSDGVLRHPSFIGLREDKPAADVVEEKPEPVAKAKKAKPRRQARREAVRRHDLQPRARDLSRIGHHQGRARRLLRDRRRADARLARPTARSASSAARRAAPSIASSRSTMPAASATRSRMCRSARRTGMRSPISTSTTAPACSPACRWARSSSTAGAPRSPMSRWPIAWCSISIPTRGSASRR